MCIYLCIYPCMCIYQADLRGSAVCVYTCACVYTCEYTRACVYTRLTSEAALRPELGPDAALVVATQLHGACTCACTCTCTVPASCTCTWSRRRSCAESARMCMYMCMYMRMYMHRAAARRGIFTENKPSSGDITYFYYIFMCIVLFFKFVHVQRRTHLRSVPAAFATAV